MEPRREARRGFTARDISARRPLFLPSLSLQPSFTVPFAQRPPRTPVSSRVPSVPRRPIALSFPLRSYLRGFSTPPSLVSSVFLHRAGCILLFFSPFFFPPPPLPIRPTLLRSGSWIHLCVLLFSPGFLSFAIAQRLKQHTYL